ncbi:hypothetical protein L7F22_024650 [Adiantum nelumboides]|nr:hypothetical protein [Adiantum nelumboides]
MHPAHTEDTSIQPSSVEFSLQEHLHQENIGRVEPSMPNFMMHRFLPAAQKIAAMEQESFIALIASRNQTTAAYPSPSRPQRPSLSHRIKRRAHHASRGFTTTGLTHAKQQDGDMSRALKSCGIFCLGLKTALFRTPHSATAARKTSRASHPASSLTFCDKGSSFSGSRNKGETDAMEGLRAARHTYSPSQASIKSHEIPLRDALKCHATLFSEGHSSVQWNPAFSQLGELDATANLDEERVGSAESGIVGLVSKKQECKQTAIECAATHNFTSSCGDDNLQISRVHDLVNANTNGSLLHIMGDVVEVISCPEQEQAWHVGGADVKSCKEHCQAWQEGSSDVDGESPFFDALSRLNSIKSTASFATCGSPATQGENLGLQDEGGAKNEEPCFMDAASDFETPTASMSEKQPMLNLAQVESKMSTTNGEPSSLSQRFGKVLKLDTREYTSVPKSLSSLNRKYPDFEDKSMLHLAGDWQVESFGCIDPGSLDRKYPLSPRTASPIFPAKCQSGSTVGWPLGISTYESSKLEGSPDHIGSEKRVKKYAPGSQLPSLPLPPAPKGSWLGKAMARNASSTSPLATVQQKYKVASARKKLDFLVAVQNSERQWEDVVKGSRVQTGHLRFSEELHQHHPLNHSAILPLKL